MTRVIGVGVLLLSIAATAFAQAPAARLLVTVRDPSGAVVVNATVTVITVDAVNAPAITPARTTAQGIATFERVALARYTISAEFPGFDAGVVENLELKAGDNRHVIVLRLRGVRDVVSVQQDRQAAASDRTRPMFGFGLSPEQIEAMSDDASELRQQLQDLVGPDGIIRVDSFEGAELPPKSQIKAVHVTRDSFAAENHSAGSVFVDVITQPGSGSLRGNANLGFHDGSMTGRSRFIPAKGREQTKSYNVGLSGTLVENRLSFSVNGGQSFYYDTPILNAALPDGTQARALDLRRPRNGKNVSINLDYALTRDQTIRVWYSQNANTNGNLGVGAYDLAERAFSSRGHSKSFRLQHGGPIGRRLFINTRLAVFGGESTSHSAVEAPTIRVNDAFTSGGAQVAGTRRNRDLRVQSDVDYVRGRHSVRGGVDLWGTWFRSTETTNYLGTYTFASLADYNAGRPTFYTRRLGDPRVDYLEFWAGAYVQDDIRVRKGLTLSPGVRYEAENLVTRHGSVGPRFGVTWAPFENGGTSIRASLGLFYDWISASTYETTLRVDGFRQRELTIVDPPYPDPGVAGDVPPVTKFLFGDDVEMGRNVRVSLGVDQTITPRLRASVLYSATRGAHALRGRNLNAPINGVRPDPAAGTVIETIADARRRSHELTATTNFSVLPGSASNAARFDWRRLSFNGSYTLGHTRGDSEGAFTVPASGVLTTEWGPAGGDVRHRLNGGLSSTALKNLSVSLSVNATSGQAYTQTTGLDNNGDLVFNDRPAGVGRGTLRYPWSTTLSGNVSYTFNVGQRSVPQTGGVTVTTMNGVSTVNAAPATSARYRFTLSARLSNLTNRTNETGFSGVMTSPFFRTATAAAEPRRINFSLSVSF